MKWILDSATLFIIVLCACQAYKKGFLNTVVRFVGTVFSVAASIMFSQPIAEFVFNNYISEKVNDVVGHHVENMADV